MQAQSVIDISQLIDARRFGWFHFVLLSLSFLLILVDGYDIIAIAFVGPVLVKEWHLDPASLGPLFGSGLAGGLFGPLIFGFIADRVGRKPVVIWGSIFFGVFTLATVWATSLGQMIALRFIAGMGLSGIIPMILALNNEYAPRNIRSTVTAASFLGIALGGGLAGFVAFHFMGTYGWQILFWSGGIAPIVLALAVAAAFPESAKFLSLKENRRAELVKTLQALAPGADFPDDARFVIGGEINRPKLRWRDLFEGPLGRITPLLWLLNLVWLMIFFFVNQWTPVLLVQRGFDISQAGLGTTLFQLGAVIGGAGIMVPIDKWGYRPVVVMCAFTIPVIAALGWPGLSHFEILTLTFLAGAGLSTLQFGTVATEAQVYPTYMRSFAVGACIAAGRGGSVLGPIIGGKLLALHLPVAYLFLIAAGALVVGFIAAMAFTPLYRRRLREGTAGIS